MVIGYVIIKKIYVFGVFPDTSPGNNIPAGAVWVNKVDKCNNG